MASRLVTLRNKIVEILSEGLEGGQFVESDFVVSASWFPVQDYAELVQNGGAVFVLARPSSQEACSREVNSVIREEYPIQVSVIFAARNEAETDSERIEKHIQLCEEIQDVLRTAGESLGYIWQSLQASRSEANVPYHYMEMAEGTFCAFFEVRYYKVFRYVPEENPVVPSNNQEPNSEQNSD